MSELRGCLQDIGLGPLLRFISEQGRSGSLRISHASWEGELVFDQGRVVGASVGELRGQVALDLIALAPEDGDFAYTDGPAPEHERNIEASPAELETPRSRVVRWSPGLVRDVAGVALLSTVVVLILRSLLHSVSVANQPVVAEIPAAAAEDTTPARVAPVLEPTPLLIEPPAPPATPTLRPLLAGAIKDQPGWPSQPNGTAWLDGNTYRLVASQLTRFVAVAAPLQTTYADVAVNAAFHKIGGPPGGGYGIIVRDQGPAPRDGVDQSGRFYVAEVSDRGEIGVWRREHDHWVELQPWTPSAAVHPGGTSNELAVRAIGQRLTFYVNGLLTTTLLDAALSSGRVGAFVGGDYNEVVLDRFTTQVLP